jgi:septal ring factor EnvC (AmiA/AmiB activator)
VLVTVIAALSSTLVNAEQTGDKAQAEKKLTTISKSIKKLKDWLGLSARAHKKAVAELKKTELAIAQLNNKLTQTNTKLKQLGTKLARLEQQQTKLLAAKKKQQATLARQIRLAYLAGQPSYLELILNQKQPGQTARILTYYKYYNQARLKEIHAFEKTLAELTQVASEVDVEKQQLAQLKTAQQLEQKELAALQQQRQQRVSQLNQEINKNNRQLEQLINEQKALERLISKIEEHIKNTLSKKKRRPGKQNLSSQPISRVKGKLSCPVAGQVIHRYGSKRNLGKLTWKGVLIKASAGTPVTALYNGQVVFANWLNGFGLLVIIDHGQGYMSLYAHNQSLLVQAGDWVAAGDPIAQVGNSGGQAQAGLYFEMRHQGKTLNPLAWCKLN